jgi:hypothetical protein
MSNLLRIIVLGLASAAVTCGCKSPSITNAPQLTLTFRSMQELPAAGVVPAHDVFPAAEGVARYAVMNEAGEKAGEILRRRASTSQFNAALSESDEESEIAYRALDEQGNIVMPAHIDLDENVITFFTPPLVLAPAELHSGQKYTSQAQMRIVNRNNQRRVRETGNATRTMEYVADELIQTPIGEFRAKRIDIQFQADLRMADVDDRLTLYLVPGIGIVAERAQTNVKILGTFDKNEHRTLVLLEKPTN